MFVYFTKFEISDKHYYKIIEVGYSDSECFYPMTCILWKKNCHAICHWMVKHQYGIRFAKFGTNDVVYVRAQNALYFDLGKEFVKLDHGELRCGESRSPY